MVSIDTNILVRFLIRDDEPQAQLARNLMQSSQVAVGATVLLELDWVLRSIYGLAKGDVLQQVAALIALPNVHLGDRAAVECALGWTMQGLDFADALHLASAGGCDAFITFDRALMSRAARLAAAPPVRAP